MRPNCPLCPRLYDFLAENRILYPDYFNQPVPTFYAKGEVFLLIVGLAPGLRGANRTGRPFTGDYAGDLLYEMLLKYGFARGGFKGEADDGLELINCAITNAVRCVPPQNKPLPLEINTCRQFLSSSLQEFSQLKAILTLGQIAHNSTMKALHVKIPFKHGHWQDVGGVRVFSSYHCSRYNTNTGVLTREMFEAVFKDIYKHLSA